MTVVPGSFVASGRWDAQRTRTVSAVLDDGSDRTVLCDARGRAISRSALRAEVAARAARLAGYAGTSRSVVAVSLADPLEMAVTLLAVMAGHTALPVNPTLRSVDAGRQLRTSGAQALVVDSTTPRRLAEIARHHGLPVVRLDEGVPGADLPPARPGDAALLLPTSGTTGAPSMVTLTNANVIAGAAASAFAYDLGPDDVRLNVMPLHHVQGIVGSLMASLVSDGATACCPFSPRDTVPQLRTTGATWFSASPTMHRMILAALDGPVEGVRLRLVRSGSAALPHNLADELRDVWRVPVVESYGLTEAHQVASTALDGRPAGPGVIGPPVGAEVAVVPAADGTPQLWLRGPVVGLRAVDAELTAEEAGMLRSGWFPTGDVGGFDAHANLRVDGRIKEMINSGGEKVAPFEVEEVLRMHPGIADAVAFGLPDPIRGEAVACLVVPRAGARLNEDVILAHVLDRLAPAKCPRWIRLADTVPTGPSGKVERRRLAEQVSAAQR
jgi:acyl-CoA synthetase (AMP-forming)/AMP-acid ligase II